MERSQRTSRFPATLIGFSWCTVPKLMRRLRKPISSRPMTSLTHPETSTRERRLQPLQQVEHCFRRDAPLRSANQISAEIQLGADATVLYINGKKQTVVDPRH